MKAIIKKRKTLSEIYSASGIEHSDDKIFIIGDDSPYLHILSKEGVLIDRKLLFPEFAGSEKLDNSTFSKSIRVPKKDKADLETLTVLHYRNRRYLLTFGSGSKPSKRDVGFLINLENYEVERFSLEDLYNSLRVMPEIIGDKKLNIEGLAASEMDIILLVRGNISGKNVIIKYNTDKLIDHLIKATPLDKPLIRSISLPKVKDIQAGLSGACYLPQEDIILFTASLEDTGNEIDDGNALGSLIGYIRPNVEKAEMVGYCLLTSSNEPYIGKVESISLVESKNKRVKAIAVTDSDGGTSELLWLDIQL